MKTNFLKTWLTMLMLVFGMGVTWGADAVQAFYWSSMGSTNTITSGYTASASGATAKTGYYQDNTGTVALTGYNKTTAMFTSAPQKVTIEAKIGGGTGNKDLTSPVYAKFVNASGTEVGNAVEITKKITNAGGDVYTFDMDLTDITSANGIKIYHLKESGYNVRYYSLKCTVTEKDDDPTVVKPVQLSDAGYFIDTKEITMSCATDGASIYYTNDGTNPTSSSTLYTAPFNITATTTIKAIAIKAGMENSEITSATYTLCTFTSLEDLAAANITNGTTVKVSFENVPIKDIYVTTQSKRNGVFFDIQKGGKDIEIYYQDVPEEWVIGGTLSGTMTCPWKLYSETWELAPAKDSWDWSNLTYKAPVQKTLSSITISGDVNTKEYMSGEALDPTGLVVTGTYSDASTEEINTGINWTLNPTTLTAGATTCEVIATVGEISSEPYTVSGLTVKALDHIAISGTPSKMNYYVGDAFDTAGLTVAAVYTDQSTEPITEGITWNITPNELTEGLTSVSVTATVGVNTSEAYVVNGLTVVKPDFETATYNFSSFTSGQTVELTDLEGFVITLNKGEGTTNPAWSSNQARVYAKSSLTVKANNATIKSIEYTYVVNANKNNVTPTIEGVQGKTNAGTWDVENKTWTGADDEVTFSTSGSAGNIGFTKLVIKYVESSKIETSLAWSAAEATVTIGANDNVFPTLTTTPADLTGVTYESSNTSVATIAADGTITLVKAGETTITAKYEGDAEHASATPASYTLTVVKAPFVPTPVAEGYETVDFKEVYSSLTENDTETIEEYEGTSFAMAFAKPQSSTTPTKYYANGTAVRAYTGNSITINGAENITNVDIAWVSGYVDNAVSITGLGTTTAVVTFSNTCRFTAITVKYNIIEERSTAQNSYGTICLPFDATAEGAAIFKLAGKNADATGLVFEYATGESDEESNTLKAGVPYLYRATADAQTFTYTEGGDVVAEAKTVNGFKGTFTKIENISGYFLYTIDNMFHLADEYVNVGAYKCYIPNLDNVVVYTPSAARQAVVFGIFGNDATGINALNGSNGLNSSKYIKNGQIVVVKNGKKYNVNGQTLK